MSDVAIRVEGLGKRYRLAERTPYKTLRETLTRGAETTDRRASYPAASEEAIRYAGEILAFVRAQVASRPDGGPNLVMHR